MSEKSSVSLIVVNASLSLTHKDQKEYEGELSVCTGILYFGKQFAFACYIGHAIDYLQYLCVCNSDLARIIIIRYFGHATFDSSAQTCSRAIGLVVQ
jgi:hypothetical protein